MEILCERQVALGKYGTTTCMKQKNNADGGHASSCVRPHGIEVKKWFFCGVEWLWTFAKADDFRSSSSSFVELRV